MTPPPEPEPASPSERAAAPAPWVARLATGALLTAPLWVLLGPVWSRWWTLRLLGELDPRVAELPLRTLLLGTGGALLELGPPADGGLRQLVALPPLWSAAPPFVVAGGGQLLAGLVARRLARRDDRRALAVLCGGTALSAALAWPLFQPPDLLSWLVWTCPASLLTGLCWLALAALRRRA